MTGKKNTMIEGLFLDVASPDQLTKSNEIYTKNKGAAIVYQLKIIRTHWVKMINSAPRYEVKMRKYKEQPSEFVMRRIAVV